MEQESHFLIFVNDDPGSPNTYRSYHLTNLTVANVFKTLKIDISRQQVSTLMPDKKTFLVFDLAHCEDTTSIWNAMKGEAITLRVREEKKKKKRPVIVKRVTKKPENPTSWTAIFTIFAIAFFLGAPRGALIIAALVVGYKRWETVSNFIKKVARDLTKDDLDEDEDDEGEERNEKREKEQPKSSASPEEDAAMAKIEQIGFPDNEVTRKILRKNKNDVLKTVAELLSSSS